jgi:hypothetical protein
MILRTTRSGLGDNQAMASVAQVRVLFVLSLLALAGRTVPSAQAESQEMSAARNRQSKAYQDYYDRLRQAGPGASAQKRKETYDATIAPAQEELSGAVANEYRISAKNAYRHNRVRVEAPTPKAGGKAKGKGTPASETSSSTAAVSGDSAPPPAPPSRPETVLDGSGVPREIEFKKKK